MLWAAFWLILGCHGGGYATHRRSHYFVFQYFVHTVGSWTQPSETNIKYYEHVRVADIIYNFDMSCHFLTYAFMMIGNMH